MNPTDLAILWQELWDTHAGLASISFGPSNRSLNPLALQLVKACPQLYALNHLAEEVMRSVCTSDVQATCCHQAFKGRGSFR